MRACVRDGARVSRRPGLYKSCPDRGSEINVYQAAGHENRTRPGMGYVGGLN
jgi:hypothetical protein